MATLNIASRANQASTFPALLIAHHAKALDPNAATRVKFEDVDSLESANKAAIELVVDTGSAYYGSEKVIKGLVDAYTCLQSKNDGLVS